MQTRGLALALPFLIGCAGSEAALRAKAARDLDCPKAQVEVLPKNDCCDNRIVRGCGLELSYESRCFVCEWELSPEPK
jgi:hypothetical protein